MAKYARILPDGSAEMIEGSAVSKGDVIEVEGERCRLDEIPYEQIQHMQHFRGSDGRWQYRDYYPSPGKPVDCYLSPRDNPLGFEGIMMSINLHGSLENAGKELERKSKTEKATIVVML